jgi:transcriptional regulatory protein LevR
MFIITSYFLNIDEHSSAIERVIPIKIQLPDISNRGLFEKIELIFDIFKKEAKKIHTTLQVSKGVITSIGCVKYKDNIIEMQNTIQSICSKAYLEMEKNKYNTAYIDFESLPQRLLENTENDSNSSLAIANLLDCIQGNIISFDKDGNSSEADIFSKSPDSFKDLRMKQFINEFNVNVNDLDNIKDYVNETIDTLINCSEPQLRAIKNNIAPEVYKTVIRVIKERQLDNFLENTQLLFGIMLHVSNYLERAKHGKVEMNISERKSLFSETYPKEYSLAEDIYSVFEKSYGIKENIRETDFLASYFVAINQLSEKTNIGILLICHGNHVASELKMYAKEASNGSYYLDAIDYHKDMQFNDLLELACIKCSELNRGSGVLILCDTEPLTTVGDYVFKHVGIITRTIDNVSLLLLLKVIELSKSPFSGIDNLVSQFNNRKGILQKQNEIHNDYLDNLKDKVIRKTVSFIDVDKAVDALSICLNDTLQELSIPYTNAIATKYLCHCTNMLERVIKGNTLDFVAINSYISKNRGLMNIVEKNLEYAGNAFGIKIPAPEIAYVSQILLDS